MGKEQYVKVKNLLDLLRRNHEQLLDFAKESNPQAALELESLRSSLLSALTSIPTSSLSKKPAPEEWSALEILDHLLEHDGDFEEISTRGVKHYIEHGQTHLDQTRKTIAINLQNSRT